MILWSSVVACLYHNAQQMGIYFMTKDSSQSVYLPFQSFVCSSSCQRYSRTSAALPAIPHAVDFMANFNAVQFGNGSCTPCTLNCTSNDQPTPPSAALEGALVLLLCYIRVHTPSTWWCCCCCVSRTSKNEAPYLNIQSQVYDSLHCCCSVLFMRWR